ncbi:MAG: UrcA family protein [Proteobacteria bacterium]|nr:UrcA family protein [Pseudomonadota bacterium]
MSCRTLSSIRRLCVLSFGAAVATLSLAAAQAADSGASVRVRYDDLNLASDAGVRVLLRRLSGAAHRVCDQPGVRELNRLSVADACYHQALANAVVAVRSERLSALYVATHRDRTS